MKALMVSVCYRQRSFWRRKDCDPPYDPAHPNHGSTYGPQPPAGNRRSWHTDGHTALPGAFETVENPLFLLNALHEIPPSRQRNRAESKALRGEARRTSPCLVDRLL